jgi:hypothetical protein
MVIVRPSFDFGLRLTVSKSLTTPQTIKEAEEEKGRNGGRACHTYSVST